MIIVIALAILCGGCWFGGALVQSAVRDGNIAVPDAAVGLMEPADEGWTLLDDFQLTRLLQQSAPPS